MENEQIKYLGSGLGFPLSTDAQGGIRLVSGNLDIEQAIRIILETSPGERVMRPTFGCRIKDYLFDVKTLERMTLMSSCVREALTIWEPRIQVRDVKINDLRDDDGIVFCEIDYEVKATHDERSIVHPFYIEKEPEII